MPNSSLNQQQQAEQPVIVKPVSDGSLLSPQQQILYGGVGLASICGVALLIREFRLLIKELRLLGSK